MNYFKGLLLASIIIVGGLGCTKREKTSVNDEQTSSVTVRNVSDVSSVQIRDGMVPNFSFTDAEGKTTDFDSFKGKVTFINFWATWCGPCKVELPDLIALSKEYESRNVKFIGISTDRGGDVLEDVRAFVQKSGISYQVVISNDDIESAFGNINAIPTTFIVDENGKILQSFVGVRSKQIFADAINQALGVTS